MSNLTDLGREWYLQKLAKGECPGSKIRSKGKGKGLGRGKGKGPMGRPMLKTAAAPRMIAKAVGAGVDMGRRMGPNSAQKLDASKLLVGGALLLGIGGALERVGRAGYQKMTKGRNLNKALEFDPEAKKIYKSNPARAEAAYNTLHKFNPEAASDPLVASSWIRQTMEQPVLPVNTVGEVVRARPKPLKSPLESASREGAKLFSSGVTAAAAPESAL